MHILLDIITYYITLTNINIYIYICLYMPMHRSIIRINRTESVPQVINVCCCIIFYYIIINIILSSAGLNGTTIFYVILFTSCCGCCIIYICIKQEESNTERDLDVIPTIIAYPIPENYQPSTVLEAVVVCEPEFSN